MPGSGGQLQPLRFFSSDLIRFLVYNLVGALLPLIISWTVRHLANILPSSGVYAPELLFFAIMISATAIGDITDEARVIGTSWLFQLLRGTLLFGAIGAATVYGMYQYDSIIGPGNTAFRGNITNFTLTIGIVLFFVSLLAEILVSKIRGASK
jgi:hypothetical protein